MLPSPALPGSGTTVGGARPPSQPQRAPVFGNCFRQFTLYQPSGPAGRLGGGQGSGWCLDGPMTSDLRARLADARLYLCTDSRRSQGDLPEFLDAVLGAGVDIVQLREKNLE